MPGNGRIIVWTVVNIEEWEITRPMARQFSLRRRARRHPGHAELDLVRIRHAGRLLAADAGLEKAGVTPTMSLNAKVCETYPEVATAAHDAGWEFIAHCYVQMPIQQIEDQRAVMRQSIDIITAFTGKQADRLARTGSRRRPSTRSTTPTECGLQLVWRLGAGRPAVLGEDRERPDPLDTLQAEINDITLMVSHHHESDVLLQRTTDAFDRLYQEFGGIRPASWRSACIRT